MNDLQSLWIWISSVTIWLKYLTFGASAIARSFSKKVSYHSCRRMEPGEEDGRGGPIRKERVCKRITRKEGGSRVRRKQ